MHRLLILFRDRLAYAFRSDVDQRARLRPLTGGRDQRELPGVGARVRLVSVLDRGAVARRIDVAWRDRISGTPPASLTRVA